MPDELRGFFQSLWYHAGIKVLRAFLAALVPFLVVLAIVLIIGPEVFVPGNRSALFSRTLSLAMLATAPVVGIIVLAVALPVMIRLHILNMRYAARRRAERSRGQELSWNPYVDTPRRVLRDIAGLGD